MGGMFWSSPCSKWISSKLYDARLIAVGASRAPALKQAVWSYWTPYIMISASPYSASAPAYPSPYDMMDLT